MIQPKRRRLHPALARTALAACLTLLAACHGASSGNADPPDQQANMDLINRVMSQVQEDYVKPVDPDQLTTNALKGMVSRLDPHSDYMDARDLRQFEGDTQGQFGGLGLEITEGNGQPQVLSPIDGTPAARAGIEPGDLIQKIDGQPTQGVDLTKVVDTLRGKPGSSVTLNILRGHQTPFDVKLTRAIINVASVKSALEPNQIGYARINSFAENTQDELTQAISDLKKKAGGRFKGFVLDLRDNPGGVLDQAVAVAGDFLDGGTVVSTRGRDGHEDESYNAKAHGDLMPGVPVVVLINSASASASEIVAGALQDRGRAKIMGTPSFGKGSVQSIIPVSGGGALRLTIALYYTPSGRSIQGRGVVPDIEVEAPADQQADTAVIREADFSGALQNTGPAVTAPPANDLNSRPIKLNLIGTAQDGQLQAALQQIQGVYHAQAAAPAQ